MELRGQARVSLAEAHWRHRESMLLELRRRRGRVPDMEVRRFSLRYDAPGPWILSGARSEGCVHFSDLAAALSFARNDASAEEADIELWVDGLYIFVHQSRGWPHHLCTRATTAGQLG